MKKSTKGAIAAGGAAVLLLGGAGTLAFWSESTTVDGGTLTSGELTLDAADCAAAEWVYADDAHGTDGDPVTLIVPGDTVEKTCDITIGGTGDHLRAEITADEESVANAAIGTDTLLVTAALTGQPEGTPIDIDGPTTVTVTISVEFPYDEAANGGNADNGSEDQTANLDDIELVATQVHD